MSNKNLLGNNGSNVKIQNDDASMPAVKMPQPTSLAEKTAGFKFQLPKAGGVSNAKVKQPATCSIASQTQDAASTKASAISEKETSNVENYQHAQQPEKIDEDATATFKENLAKLQAAFGTKQEAVAFNVRNCMEYLQSHTELRDILQPEDIQIMVRGLRVSYGIIAQKKRNNKSKRAKNEADVDEIVAMLGDFKI